ncbi:CHAT domain-containing protein [Nonomuraea lactucae]|uniref:CHAT domain-containing protein n=1 Tax=Nonomuraea lactucae TaxID=2249762 RepID=UPI000DE57A70|nr:CHAT domain-containing protein [Nonomuraea lactucae]
MDGADLARVDATLSRVVALIDAHQLDSAERLLKPLMQDSPSLPPDRRTRVLLEWGWLHGATQRYVPAREALAEAVAVAESLRSWRLLCEALRESGTVARYEGEFQAADRFFERSEQVARDEGHDLELGQALFQRGTVAHHVGEFVKARRLLQEAGRAAERCPPSEAAVQLLADVRRECAVSARLVRDFDTARELLVQSLDSYRSIGRRVGAANAQRELGAVLEQVGNEREARRYFTEAFTGYMRAGRRMGAAQVARRLGYLDLLAAVGDAAAARRARRRFTQALRLGGGEPVNRVLSTLYLGKLARLEADLDAAEELLYETVQQYSGMEAGQGVARGLSQVAMEAGLIARERGDRAAAIARFHDALAALRVADDPSAASLVHYHLATDLILMDEVKQATHHAVAAFSLNEAAGRRLLDPAERRSFYEAHRETYGLALHCAARSGDGRAALRVATAARSDALAAFVRAGARFTPQLHELVQDITLASAEPGQQAEDRLRDLYGRLEHETSRQMRRTVEADTDLDEMIASLPRGGHALLLDVLEEDDTFCNRIWLSPDGVPHVDEVILPMGVRRFLDAYHQAREEAAWRPQRDDLAALGHTIVPDGLAEALAAGANPPLVIGTGSVLGPVPLAAVMIEGRYLAEQAQLAVVPSLALWPALRSRGHRPGRGTLAYFDSNVPGWRRENAALQATLAPVDLAGADEVRGMLADASAYAAVVISAHGASPEQEQDGVGRHPGLAQALELTPDDLLTAAELLGCRLPDAFITASCWSGRLAVRAAIEPLGLPTAALLAGARWVLAGTVDIGSTSTATLLAGFYRELADGMTPAAALQRAQTAYLSQRPDTAPGTWAGLTIIGDGFVPLRFAGSGPE